MCICSLSDELITRPEDSYRLWCVVVCDLETSLMRRPWPSGGYWAREEKKNCSLNYPACNAHEPYCYICPARLWLYNIFSTLSHKRHDFLKNIISYKTCVLIFSTIFSKTFLILRRTEGDMIISVYWSLCNVSLFDFNEFPLQIFEKYSTKSPSSASRVAPCRQTDG
jgi:hypothetical protein